jgi:hypothetical protein
VSFWTAILTARLRFFDHFLDGMKRKRGSNCIEANRAMCLDEDVRVDERDIPSLQRHGVALSDFERRGYSIASEQLFQIVDRNIQNARATPDRKPALLESARHRLHHVSAHQQRLCFADHVRLNRVVLRRPTF